MQVKDITELILMARTVRGGHIKSKDGREIIATELVLRNCRTRPLHIYDCFGNISITLQSARVADRKPTVKK